MAAACSWTEGHKRGAVACKRVEAACRREEGVAGSRIGQEVCRSTAESRTACRREGSSWGREVRSSWFGEEYRQGRAGSSWVAPGRNPGS